MNFRSTAVITLILLLCFVLSHDVNATKHYRISRHRSRAPAQTVAPQTESSEASEGSETSEYGGRIIPEKVIRPHYVDSISAVGGSRQPGPRVVQKNTFDQLDAGHVKPVIDDDFHMPPLTDEEADGAPHVSTSSPSSSSSSSESSAAVQTLSNSLTNLFSSKDYAQINSINQHYVVSLSDMILQLAREEAQSVLDDPVAIKAIQETAGLRKPIEQAPYEPEQEDLKFQDQLRKNATLATAPPPPPPPQPQQQPPQPQPQPKPSASSSSSSSSSSTSSTSSTSSSSSSESSETSESSESSTGKLPLGPEAILARVRSAKAAAAAASIANLNPPPGKKIVIEQQQQQQLLIVSNPSTEYLGAILHNLDNSVEDIKQMLVKKFGAPKSESSESSSASSSESSATESSSGTSEQSSSSSESSSSSSSSSSESSSGSSESSHRFVQTRGSLPERIANDDVEDW